MSDIVTILAQQIFDMPERKKKSDVEYNGYSVSGKPESGDSHVGQFVIHPVW
jgi:hypothetical protein